MKVWVVPARHYTFHNGSTACCKRQDEGEQNTALACCQEPNFRLCCPNLSRGPPAHACCQEFKMVRDIGQPLMRSGLQCTQVMDVRV